MVDSVKIKIYGVAPVDGGQAITFSTLDHEGAVCVIVKDGAEQSDVLFRMESAFKTLNAGIAEDARVLASG